MLENRVKRVTIYNPTRINCQLDTYLVKKRSILRSPPLTRPSRRPTQAAHTFYLRIVTEKINCLFN